jgi:hypothetical protein
MRDGSPELRAAVRAALRIDPDLLAAFAPGTVPVYQIPPVNKRGAYFVLPGADVLELAGQGMDLSEPELALHLWSQTDPPGFTQVDTLGPLALAVILGLAGTETASFYIRTADYVRGETLTDPDGLTVHRIDHVAYVLEPKG